MCGYHELKRYLLEDEKKKRKKVKVKVKRSWKKRRRNEKRIIKWWPKYKIACRLHIEFCMAMDIYPKIELITYRFYKFYKKSILYIIFLKNVNQYKLFTEIINWPMTLHVMRFISIILGYLNFNNKLSTLTRGLWKVLQKKLLKSDKILWNFKLRWNNLLRLIHGWDWLARL